MAGRTSRFEANPIIVEQYPSWIEQLPMHYINAKLMRIVQFYVFNSPCRTASWGRISMEQYGWTNYWHSNHFRSAIYNNAELADFYSAENPTALARIWPDKENFSYSTEEFAYFVNTGEESPLMSVFHSIRNSFAHGRFRINGDYIFFEDVKNDKKNTIVMARICLKCKTLENWIHIIKCDDNNECGRLGRDIKETMKANRLKNTNRNKSHVS